MTLTTVVVSDYDPAIRFFVDALGFDLVEDSPALTNAGRPKRWVVVRPPGATTGLLLGTRGRPSTERSDWQSGRWQGCFLPPCR